MKIEAISRKQKMKHEYMINLMTRVHTRNNKVQRKCKTIYDALICWDKRLHEGTFATWTFHIKRDVLTLKD